MIINFKKKKHKKNQAKKRCFLKLLKETAVFHFLRSEHFDQ